MHIRTLATTILGIVMRVGGDTPVHAQAPGSALPVDSIVRRLDREIRAHDNRGYADGLIVVTLNHGSDSARKDSLLTGLTELVNSSDNSRVRVAAVSWIAFAGEDGRSARPLPRIVQRLERLYRKHSRDDDYAVRLAIVSALPLQGERTEAAALLRTIASEPDPANNGTGPHGYLSVGDLRTEAISGLATMGDQGRTALQAMYRNRVTLSPQAQIVLETMAQHAFPVTDIVERRRAATRRMLQQP